MLHSDERISFARHICSARRHKSCRVSRISGRAQSVDALSAPHVTMIPIGLANLFAGNFTQRSPCIRNMEKSDQHALPSVDAPHASCYTTLATTTDGRQHSKGGHQQIAQRQALSNPVEVASSKHTPMPPSPGWTSVFSCFIQKKTSIHGCFGGDRV